MDTLLKRKLTKAYVDTIPYLESGQVIYRDTELKGFALRVGKTSKTYIVESKVNGRAVRTTIGKSNVFTAEEARQHAKRILGKMAVGENPVDEKRNLRAKSVTLAEVIQEYVIARKTLSPRTIYDYTHGLKTYIGDWLGKPMSDISKDMIAKRHTLIGQRSHSQANQVMRGLSALFNFAIIRYEDSTGNSIITDNPVRRLTQTRAWYKIKRRTTVIRAYDLPAWYRSVSNLKNDHTSRGRETFRDYLVFLLLTGLRRSEAATLEWRHVDLDARLFRVMDTKNGEDHTLPLSDFLYDMLQQRRMHIMGRYVFPGDTKEGYILLPQKLMRRVTRESGVEFTLHDLRRTFITIAESLDIPAYALKRLLNHKMRNDVTAGYIITDVERLRAPMQKVTDYILKVVGVRESAEVVAFPFPSAVSLSA